MPHLLNMLTLGTKIFIQRLFGIIPDVNWSRVEFYPLRNEESPTIFNREHHQVFRAAVASIGEDASRQGPGGRV